MRFGMNYADPGSDHYEQHYRERAMKQLHRRVVTDRSIKDCGTTRN